MLPLSFLAIDLNSYTFSLEHINSHPDTGL